MAKKSEYFAQFFYRVNPDSTFDSICGYVCLLWEQAKPSAICKLLIPIMSAQLP